MPEQEIKAISADKFGEKADWFKVLWVNRNATRKLGADVISCFNDFLNALEKKHGHRKAMMIMHTDPFDIEGANLVEVSNLYNLRDHVVFSNEKLAPKDMNLMHNLCDTLINIAKAEGFGLSTLIQMMVGKPIIAMTTGGMTRQVVDHRDGTENGVAIPPASQQLVGSQMVPYIYEDFTNHQQVVDAFMKIHDLTPDQKESLKKKVLEYVDYEFNFQKVVEKWDTTLENCIKDFKKQKPRTWTFKELQNPTPTPITQEQKTEQVLKQNQIAIDPEVQKLPMDITSYLMKNVKITRATAK